MTWNQAIIAYAVAWWLLFLMALSVGVRGPADAMPGISRGAPQRGFLARKCAAVTVLAALLTWAIDIALKSGIVALR